MCASLEYKRPGSQPRRSIRRWERPGTGTAANSGSVSTTAASELIFGAGTSGSSFTTAGTGFTSRMINLYGNIAEDKTVNATGSYNATATDSSGVWVMQVATFKAAP